MRLLMSRKMLGVLAALFASLVGGCKKSGEGGGGLFEKPAPLRPKVIDDKLVASVLGEFKPVSQDEDRWYQLTIAADKVRCNHSNHKDEYTSHPYAVASAVDGRVVLRAPGGILVLKVDGDGDKVAVEADGICPWGISSPYKRVKPMEGKPAELLAPQTPSKRDAVRAKIGEETKLPRGSVTLTEVKKGTWEGDGDSTPVVELKVTVQPADGSFVDPFLAADIADVASTDKQVWSVGCDEAESRSIGNPGFKEHREPRFDLGIYTALGGHRDTLLKPGSSRSGWITLLMKKRATGTCKVKFDAVGLGAGVIEWSTKFD